MSDYADTDSAGLVDRFWREKYDKLLAEKADADMVLKATIARAERAEAESEHYVEYLQIAHDRRDQWKELAQGASAYVEQINKGSAVRNWPAEQWLAKLKELEDEKP